MNNHHLDKSQIEFYITTQQIPVIERSKETIQKLEDIYRHVDRCPSCAAHLKVAASFYLDESTKYDRNNRVRKQVIAGFSLVVLLTLIIPRFSSVEKTNQIVDYTPGYPSLQNADSSLGSTTTSLDSSPGSSQVANSANSDSSTLKANVQNEETTLSASGKESQEELVNALVRTFLASSKSNSIDLKTFAEKESVSLPSAFWDDPAQETQLRTLTYRAHSNIEILAPGTISIYTEKFVFRWNAPKPGGMVVIKDNQNNKVWQETNLESNTIICKSTFRPGLYYWDLRIDGMIRKKGKFFVLSLNDPEG